MSKITELLCVTEDEIRKVRLAYQKTEKDIEEDVDLLLEWLNKQPHLPKALDRIRLEHFLLRNKFRIEQTKIKLDNYYSFKVFYPDFYKDLDPESPAIQKVRKSFITVPMPRLSPDLNRILYCTFLENQEEHFNMLHLLEYFMIFWEFQLTQDYSVGDTYVCDYKNLTAKYVTKMDLNVIHKMLLILQQGFSGRFGLIHYINVSPAVDLLMSLLKKVLATKIFGKIRVHKNFESLYEFIPKDCMPKEAGGNLEPIQDIADKWVEEMIRQKEFLKENAARKSNEKLRIGKSAHNELFGLDGTFRKINLD